MNRKSIALALSISLSFFGLASAPETANANVTSVMFGGPVPDGGKLSMNTVHTFTGTLRCATYGYNNALVFLKLEGFGDIGMQYRSFAQHWTPGTSVPVDQNAPNGDQHFQLVLDTTDILTSDTKVLRAKWAWWDCGNNYSESANWTYIQAPATQVVAEDRLAVVGAEPTVSFKVKTYPLFASNHPPMEQVDSFQASGIFTTEPECLFENFGDRYTATELAAQGFEEWYDIECSGAVLASTESWRTGAVVYRDGLLETYDAPSLPIAATLFADLRDENGSSGLGVFDATSLGDTHLVHSFTPDGFGDAGFNYRYGVIDSAGLSAEFEGCSQDLGHDVEGYSDGSFAFASGRMLDMFNIASLIRLYLQDSQPMCDTAVLFDTQSNPIIGAPLDVAFATSYSAYVLSEDSGTVYEFALPERSTESWEVHYLDALAEVTIPSGISLSSLVVTPEGELIGIEATNSHVALHTININDVSNSPLVASFTVSDLIPSWEIQSEKYIVSQVQTAQYLALQIHNSANTGSKTVTLDLNDFTAVAVIEDLDESWCPVAAELGYHFTSHGYYMGCIPKLFSVTAEGATILLSGDLQILRTPSASATTIHVQPEPEFSHPTGLNEDDYSAWGLMAKSNRSGDQIWLQDSYVTFRNLSLPAATFSSLQQSPGVNPGSNQISNPITQAASNAAESFVPVKVPELNLNAAYFQDSEVIIPTLGSDLLEIWIGSTSISFSATIDGAVFSLVGHQAGRHDLTVVSNLGSFTFTTALNIIERPLVAQTVAGPIRVHRKTAVSKVIARLNQEPNVLNARVLTCAYFESRKAARSKCGTVAKELGKKLVLVRVRQTATPNGDLLLRLKD